MPYHNMPASMWPKMDKCVNEVQATGKDKQAAIAICYTSLMGKSMETEHKASDQPGDYLIVEDREKPTTWHLQVRDNGTPDHRLMGAAHAALMSPNGYRGNKYEGPNKTEAIAKLRRLYEQEGLTWPEAKDVKDWGMGMMDQATLMPPVYGPTTIADALAQEQAQEQAEQLQDAFGTFQGVVNNIMYSPDVTDKGAAIEKEAGAFRQWFDSILSGVKSIVNKMRPTEAKPAEYTPRAPEPFTLFKDAKGQWHWLAIATNNRRDSDHPAQILTDAAHKEFMQYLDAHPEAMPELWHWHTPGTKWGTTEFVDYTDGFMVYAGTVDPGHELEAEHLAQAKDIGVSHGFVVLSHDVENEHINQYRTFEISPLPLEAAANRWTIFQAIKEAGMPFDQKRRAYLVSVAGLGEERVKKLEEDLSAASKTLDSIGIEKKSEETPNRTPNAGPGAESGPQGAPEAKPEDGASVGTHALPTPEAETEKKEAWFVADMKPEEFTKLVTSVMEQVVNPQLNAIKQETGTAIVSSTKELSGQFLSQLTDIVKSQSDLDKRLKVLEGLTPRAYRASQDPATAVDATKVQKAAPAPDQKANDFLAFVLGQTPQ